jgi:putative SOS response-associated peptidase YedK
MFNAKSETLAKSRAYREPFKRRRCIVPVSGYYEWKKEGSLKVPYYIEPDQDPGFALAGLWDRWEKDGQVIESCTIVTAAAPEEMKFVHHRIPVHMTVAQANEWTRIDTTAESLGDMLKPEIRTSIRVTPVSTIVNNARNKDERCVEPLGDAIKIH